MGIQGLLPQLRSIMKPIHVQDLRGQTVAVDTYSWLHKGAVHCSLQLCKGILTTKHIEYCMHRVKLLQHHGVKPILVFDGGLLPMKIDQETKRARKRKENLERALEQEAAGNFGAASDCYQKAVDISPSIAFELIQVLKQENVDYIVAPYEADAQMTFLSMYKHADAVITEDSDLIPFGCSRIIFKMDKFGHGVEFQSSMLEQNRDLDFTGFSKQMILEMCIFSGCDYLPSLPGMGLKRAHAIIRKYKSYEKVIKHLRYSGVPIPTSYEGIFKQAVWAFQHQRVYDPEKECLVHLSDVPQDTGEDLNFLGPWLPPDVAKGIAQGNVDPFTKSAFQVEIRSSSLAVEKAFSMKNLETADKRNRLELPVQKNVLTNYFCLASIQAKRKFKAPKVLMKPSCPSSNSPVSDSPGSDETPLSFASNQSQDFPVDSLMEDRLPNRCYNSLVSLPANPKPHEEHGTELKCVENKSVKRKVSRSPYFSNALACEDTGGHENKEDCAAVLDHQPASLCEPNKTSSVENSIKKRKTVHIFDKETLPLENVISTPAFTTGQDERIVGSYKENRDEEGKKFGRDISHVKDYCGIAEKSMERFATLMNSFRYNSSSGSRASGLRPPPPKVVQNNKFSVSSNKKLLDFSQFSYKPPEKID